MSAVSGTFNFRMRFVETTRYSNWFFTAGDHSSFTLLRNNTAATLAYTIEWRDPSGAIVGTTSGTLVANGNIAVNSKPFTGATLSGSVQIAHNGAPNAIVGPRSPDSA